MMDNKQNKNEPKVVIGKFKTQPETPVVEFKAVSQSNPIKTNLIKFINNKLQSGVLSRFKPDDLR